MTAYANTGRAVSRGLNETQNFTILVPVATALANADTYAVTLPDGFDKNYLPTSVLAAKVSGSTYIFTENANIALTNHNPTTGVTTLTASGAVAAGSILRISYSALLP